MMVSESFQLFAQEAPAIHKAWMEMVNALENTIALDKKTKELAYLLSFLVQIANLFIPIS